MCGICGIINLNSLSVQEAPIRKMMHIQKHRGPDDEGIFVENNVGLGFVRLSILDLSYAGHQPMFSSDGQYVVVYNGEIYNYIELREELKTIGYQFRTNSDTEVLLAAFQHWGEDCLHRFNGMWAFVIYDRKKKNVFAARDRYGVKPLYYLYSNDYFAFSSEIPPLLSLLNHRPKPDYQSIFDYLVFNRTDQTERTFFEEVKKLQHGQKIILDGQRLSIKKWYDLRKQVSIIEGFKNPVEFRELFSSAVGLRLRSDVPVGVCLSGGLDSSSIISVLIHDYKKNDLNTFSAVYKKGQYGDETEFIKEYKSLLKNMFFITPDAKTLENDVSKFVKAHGEPIPDTSPYAQYKVMELAKDHVVVTLDGQGADEELAGYHYFFGFFFKDLLKQGRGKKLSAEMFYYLSKHHSFFGIKSFLYFLLPERIRTIARVREKGYVNKDFVYEYKDNNAVASNIYGSKSLHDALLDHFEYKLEHLLKWEDRNSMKFSIEARVPFLDYRLVEKTLATSDKFLINDGMTKYLLRESMKGTLAEKIRLRRDKIGFATPQDEWFRTKAWQEIIMNVLQSESFRSRKLVVPEKAILLYRQHMLGKKNIAGEIWKWIHLEKWFKTFID